MGISVEQWRASIGRWARGGVVSSKVNSAVTSPQFYFFLVLLVLLVIGGVEMNPGPVQSAAADMAGELYESETQTAEEHQDLHITAVYCESGDSNVGSNEMLDLVNTGAVNVDQLVESPELLQVPKSRFSLEVTSSIIKTIAANISKHIPKLNVKFSQDACQEIREKYQNTNRKLFIKSNCIKMSVIKVLQSFDSNTLLIDISTIQKCMNIHKAEQQFVDTFCLSQLEPDSRQQVLESQVDFQGYTVVEQLHNTLQIGQKLQELDPCYLHRTFQRRDLLNEMIFKEEGITLAVSGTTKACLATLVPPGEKVEKFIPGSFDKNAG
ncbi:hypothetical protein L9F63_012365, partial [Diploptera punctata]